jgi:hypothetical protein
MRVNEQATKIFKVAVVSLLLIFAVTAAQAQWPKPTTPPTPATIPAFQTVPIGFDTLGFIEYASVDALCDPVAPSAPLDTTAGVSSPVATPTPTPAVPTPAACKTSGGWIQVNNDTIRVPQNTVVVFPNTVMTWEEAFENNPTGVPGETGMALSDSVRLPGTYEVHVQGNVVHGTYIAGLLFVSQQSANGSMGYIESVNYADGSFTINGNRVQLNDPAIQITDLNGNIWNKGRYSTGQSPDSRFTADQGNPTVRAQTGFPMCIPRVAPGTWTATLADGVTNSGTVDPYLGGFDDPQCPEINRPRDETGAIRTIYTMNAPGDAPTVDNPFPQDPYTEVPFEVGDFVSMISTLELDDQGKPYLSATEVVANLGVFTFPNTDPAYVVIEVLLQGAGGVGDPSFPQEAARRTRVEGMMTDPLRNIDISAIDIDCNGNLVFRLPTWVSSFPVEQGLPLIGKKGRWRFRPNGGTFLPPVQNVAAQISGSVAGVNNNGLVFNYYQLPNPEFIFPEDLVSGNLPPRANFNDLPFLVNGTGPWPVPSSVFDSELIQLNARRAETPVPQTSQSIGQLNPFPDDVTPAVGCSPNNVPGGQAQAVASFSGSANPITAGTTVTLSSAGSTPVNGPFLWAQVVNPGDPVVTIVNPTSPTATFIAPVVGPAGLSLGFSLTVGGGNTTQPSTTTLSVPVVAPPPGTAPSVFATSTPVSPVQSAANVTLNATGVDPSGGTLTFTWIQTGGPAVVLTPAAADGSVQTFVAPTVPDLVAPQGLTFTVTATSSTVGLATASTSITVVVNPVNDLITVAHVRYIEKIARLVINASDFTPGVRLFVTLAGPNGESPTINPATGAPYTGEMGPVIPFATGVFTIRFTNVPPPPLTTIRSSAGGIVTSGVTITR